MTRSTRGRRVGAALVTLGFVLVGCSDADGDAAPTTSPSPEDTPTTEEPTTPAPGPTPWPEPTRPAEMERDDIEGAKAAAQYFLELYPYVYVTGDLEPWHEISHEECQFCASVTENVQALHGAGGYADGPAIEVLAVEAAPPDQEYEFFSVWIDAQESDAAWYDATGAVTERIEGSLVEVDMALARDGSQWQVRGAVGTDVEEEG